mgnify:CR=1 FL=1
MRIAPRASRQLWLRACTRSVLSSNALTNYYFVLASSTQDRDELELVAVTGQ